MLLARPVNKHRQIESLAWVKENYRRVTDLDEARRIWTFWVDHLSAPQGCIHANNCGYKRRGEPCTIGNACETRELIAGAILPVFAILQSTTDSSGYGRDHEGRKRHRPEVVRGTLDDGTPIIGLSMNTGDMKLVCDKVRGVGGLMWVDVGCIWMFDDDVGVCVWCVGGVG